MATTNGGHQGGKSSHGSKHDHASRQSKSKSQCVESTKETTKSGQLSREGDADKRRHVDDDPDGALNVARDLFPSKAVYGSNRFRSTPIIQDVDTQYAELVEKTESNPQVQQFLSWGSTGHHQNERLKALEVDDAHGPSEEYLKKLNPKQRHALEKRQARRNDIRNDIKDQVDENDETDGNDNKKFKKRTGDKIMQNFLHRSETKRLRAAVAAAEATEILQTEQAGLIEAEHEMERTYKLTQVQLKRDYLDVSTSRHIYDLSLPQTAPYGLEYDRSGRYSILYGQSAQGHLALMDCHQQTLLTELYIQERIRDACFLHNFSLFAVAQKSCVYIYDNQGAEVHQLDQHNDPMAMQFLPYHWLLASIGRSGYLVYQDTSTGQMVSKHSTRLGPCSVLKQNPSNAVVWAGHGKGIVTAWSPTTSQYLVKMRCHKGCAVTGIAMDPTNGYTMVTSSIDGKVKIWDLRTYQLLHQYTIHAGRPTSVDISQRGILGVGHAGHVTFWNSDGLRHKTSSHYMEHSMPGCGPVETVRFRPFEDVCGIGHARGISSIVVPGAGEPSIDTAEYNTNPFQDAKQRREAEVRALLDKLSPNMIVLDPDAVGGVEESTAQNRLERLQDLEDTANSNGDVMKKKKETTKKRGRSKIQTKLRRRQQNVIDQQTTKMRETLERQEAAKDAARVSNENHEAETLQDQVPAALQRFFGK